MPPNWSYFMTVWKMELRCLQPTFCECTLAHKIYISMLLPSPLKDALHVDVCFCVRECACTSMHTCTCVNNSGGGSYLPNRCCSKWRQSMLKGVYEQGTEHVKRQTKAGYVNRGLRTRHTCCHPPHLTRRWVLLLQAFYANLATTIRH